MLPPSARLRKSRDFQAVYRTRKSWATPCLSLHVRWVNMPTLPGSSSVPRFGFVISKKVAKRAHVRNLLKRRMREISRGRLMPGMHGGTDVLFVARAAALELDFAKLADEMDGLLRQSGLLTTVR